MSTSALSPNARGSLLRSSAPPMPGLVFTTWKATWFLWGIIAVVMAAQVLPGIIIERFTSQPQTGVPFVSSALTLSWAIVLTVTGIVNATSLTPLHALSGADLGKQNVATWLVDIINTTIALLIWLLLTLTTPQPVVIIENTGVLFQAGGGPTGSSGLTATALTLQFLWWLTAAAGGRLIGHAFRSAGAWAGSTAIVATLGAAAQVLVSKVFHAGGATVNWVPTLILPAIVLVGAWLLAVRGPIRKVS